MGPYPDKLVEAVAIALFDYEETLTLQTIEKMDAEGRRDFGDSIGRERDTWDNPDNTHCHDGYRRRAKAALDAVQTFGVELHYPLPGQPQPKGREIQTGRKAGAA
jgi:hypothetical protein